MEGGEGEGQDGGRWQKFDAYSAFRSGRVVVGLVGGAPVVALVVRVCSVERGRRRCTALLHWSDDATPPLGSGVEGQPGTVAVRSRVLPFPQKGREGEGEGEGNTCRNGTVARLRICV